MKSLNELIDRHLGAAVGLPAQPWVQGLRNGVNSDPYWALILSALDSYGRSGRFYYLDQLAEQPQLWQSPLGLSYSVGFGLSDDMAAEVDQLPDGAWTPAYDADGVQRDGAWVAELTGVLDLKSWPVRMRVLVRAERPHPGAQLRFTNVQGNRLTAFATNTTGGQLADLELRHRR